MYTRARPVDVRAANRTSEHHVFTTVCACTPGLETIHPEPYERLDSSEAAQSRVKLEQGLRDGMSRLQFWRLAAPAVALFRDGHTRMAQPEEEWERIWTSGSSVFPPVLVLDSTGATVEADLSSARRFPPGTRVRSINDRPVAELMREGMATLSYEHDRLRLWALNRSQTRMYAMVWDWTGPCRRACDAVREKASAPARRCRGVVGAHASSWPPAATHHA